MLAEIADGAVGNVRSGLDQHWRVLRHQRGGFNFSVRDQSADAQHVVPHLNALERFDGLDVDQQQRFGRPWGQKWLELRSSSGVFLGASRGARIGWCVAAEYTAEADAGGYGASRSGPDRAHRRGAAGH